MHKRTQRRGPRPTRSNLPRSSEPVLVIGGTAAEVIAAGEAIVATRKAAGQHSSPFVGVHWAKKDRRWQATLTRKGHRAQFLGYFLQETAAAQAVLDAKMQLAQAEAAEHQPVPPAPYLALAPRPPQQLQRLQQSPQTTSVQQPRAEQGQQWPTSDGLAFEARC